MRKIPHRFIDGVEVKRCSICKLWLLFSSFWKNSAKWDRLAVTCKKCHKKLYSSHYREKSKRDYYNSIKRRYGITLEQYNQMLTDQGGVCAICGRPPKKNRLNVDHNHDTGEVRGLLCIPCNRYIGGIEENVATARKLVQYLERSCLEKESNA